MDREEAEALANQMLNHYGKQSWNEHFRASVPVDNPAKHMLVKDARQFIAMAERRGYGPVHEEKDDQGWLCWLNSDYAGRCYVRESFFLYETVATVADKFDKWFGGLHHHICCSKCKEPLLIGSSQKMALDIYHRSTKPSLMLQVEGMSADEVIERLKSGLPLPKEGVTILHDNTDMENAIAKSTGYRSPKAGPDSPMLSKCPGCGAVLSSETTEEIRDDNHL